MKRFWAFGFFAIAVACGPCNPPPGNDIEIAVGPFPAVWSRDIAQNDNYSWEGEPTLNVVPALDFAKNDPNFPINARYRSLGETIAAVFHPASVGSGPLVFRPRPELHLFARDPRELYFSLAFAKLGDWPSIMSGPTTFGANAPPYEVPADMVIPYGTNTPLDIYPTQTIANVFWQNFWISDTGTVLTPGQWDSNGVAAGPGGFGSIKAIHSTELPECSTKVDIESAILSAVRDRVTGSLASCRPFSSLCGTGLLLPSLVGLNATSYLNHVDPKLLTQTPLPLAALEMTLPADPDEGVVAGVLIAGDIHAGARVDSNNCGYDLEPCDVSFLYDMQFGVDANGYFALIPHRIRLDATNGSLCNGFGTLGDIFGLVALKPTVQHLFEVEFPQAVHDAAKGQQRIPPPESPPLCNDDGATCTSNFECCSRECGPSSTCLPSNTLPWSCVYNINEAGVNSADYDPAAACFGARFELKQAALQAALDLGLTSTQESVLDTIIDAKENWRCRRPSGDEVVSECSKAKQVRGKCEFKVPAEKIVPEPDEVRLAFSELDNFITACPTPTTCTIPNPSDPHEFQSSVAFLLSYFAGGTNAVEQNLCNPPPAPNSSNFYNRYFATLAIGSQQCQSPPPACHLRNDLCAQNSDCCSGVCTNGQCADQPKLVCGCQFDTDCALGDTCTGGTCKNVCHTGSDCESTFCYTDISLCQSPPTGQDCQQSGVCFPWEYCQTGSGGSVCVERLPQPFAVDD